jgi:C-terminal processing protease CtpA/Prc
MWRARLRAGSSVAWERRRASLYLLLATDRDLKVTVEKASGERREFSLVLPEDTPATVTYPEPPPSVTSERLPSGLGLITIRTFGGGPELVRAFDRALDGMMDAPGLIIDVRENNGGMSLLADLMVGRLVEEPFLYGQEFHRARLPQRLWRRRIDYRVLPRGKSYDGPVALLIDTRTYSSGETFAAALTLSDRAYAIGRTTAGATGNPVYVRLPGGKARFSTGDWRYLDGSPLEGLGVRPDLEVAWTVEDLRAGRDPDLAAAEAHLLGVAAE